MDTRWAGSRHVVVALLLLLFAVGCGGFKYAGTDLHGQVTMDGQPIAAGTIQFIPVDGDGTVIPAEIKNGEYTASMVPVGNVKVFIMATKETGKMVTLYDNTVPEVVSIIPEKYLAGIDQEIQAGTKSLDFSLDSK